MARSQRLLDLIQALRRHRLPVSGAALAGELGVSLRTLYRDIKTLQAQGAHIDGEAGIGYVLRPGFMLPPLMFSEEEIEALVLGSRWVSEQADGSLGAAARNALAKIGAVLPKDLSESLYSSGLMVGSGKPAEARDGDLALIRAAIRSEQKVQIAYAAEDGRSTERIIWPFALAFFDRVRVVAAWCELREGYRHFRTDRITALVPRPERFPRRRVALLKAWRDLTGVRQQ